MLRLMQKKIGLAAAITITALAGGCMGSFGLTKAVYTWNDTVTGNKIINNVIFWALAIIPVYEITLTIDVVILNTIEFWTGGKLMGDAGSDSDTRVAVKSNDDGSITVVRGDRVFTLVPDGDDRALVVVDGAVVGVASQDNTGAVVAKDLDGDVLTSLTGAQVASERKTIVAAID